MLNGIYSKVQALPTYVTSTSYIYKNYYRNFITWQIEAREFLETLVNNEDEIASIKSAQLAIMIINILIR